MSGAQPPPSLADEELVAALDEALAAARRRLAALAGPALPWPERVALGLRCCLEMVAAEPGMARLCLVEAEAVGGLALARRRALLEELAAELRRGRRLRARPDPLPEELEPAIVAALAWLVGERLDRAEDLEAVLPDMLVMALAPYVGEEEANRIATEAGRLAEKPLCPV